MMEQLEGELVQGDDEKLIADGDDQEVWQSMDGIAIEIDPFSWVVENDHVWTWIADVLILAEMIVWI